MSREVWIEKSSYRNYRGLDENIQDRIKTAVEACANKREPSKHPKVKLLEGPKETVYRLRVGDYRVIFTTEMGKLKIWTLGARKDIYDRINNTYDRVSA